MFAKITLTLSFFLCSVSFGAIGAVSTATGGTGVGAVEPVDGLLLNPAFVADMPAKDFSVNYSADAWALTIADNGQDSFFPAGLQMVSFRTDTLNTQKLGLSFTLPRMKRLVVGATASMVEYSYNPTGNMDNKYRQAVADVGLTYGITRDIGIGLVANKVGATKIDLQEGLQLQKTATLGLSYTYDNFLRLRLDVESGPDYKTNKLVNMIGIENYLNEWVVFRLGYQNNKVLEKDYMTGGLGFAGPQFGLHYALISNTVDRSDQKHLFDLAIPF